MLQNVACEQIFSADSILISRYISTVRVTMKTETPCIFPIGSLVFSIRHGHKDLSMLMAAQCFVRVGPCCCAKHSRSVGCDESRLSIDEAIWFIHRLLSHFYLFLSFGFRYSLVTDVRIYRWKHLSPFRCCCI